MLGNPDMPPLDLFLCNTTGETHTGLHYDPVTLRKSVGERSAVEPAGSGAALQTDRKDKRKKLRRSNAFNPHDEKPSFLKLLSTCRGECAGGDACLKQASASASAGIVKESGSGSRDHVDDENVPLVDEKETGTFYKVWAMSSSDSPDVPRQKLEDALDTLSFEFREHPTLPGDPSDATKSVSGALDKTKGLLLPLKHCAFRC